MQLNRDTIAQILPHQGAMCLLDEVLGCDGDSIVCRATSHRAADNPMRTSQGLGVATGIEYAAQAMALHAALQAMTSDAQVQPRRLPAGALASVRSVSFDVDRLDTTQGDLLIEASLVSGDSAMALYSFKVTSDGRSLLSGRASVVIRPDALAPAPVVL